MPNQTEPQRLYAVRGAVQVKGNNRDAILAGTGDLLRELVARNSLHPDAMVSCIFTTTNDLDAEFPAVAARQLGLESVPLLCAREIAVPDSMPRIVRVLLHYYADAGGAPAHTYLGAAQELRSDLEAAQ